MAVAARPPLALRRWLMLPPEEVSEAALRAGAEALIVDFPGSRLSPEHARARLAHIARTAAVPLYARLAPSGADGTEADIAAAAEAGLSGVVPAGAGSGADVQRLGALLAVAEARASLADGAMTVLPCLDSGAGLLRLASLPGASPRLEALLWDGESLARDVGAEAARDPDGRWTGCCSTARGLVLAAAAAAGVPAIDARFSGGAGDPFRREAEAARRDGFRGKVACDAAQLAALQAVFATSG